MNVLSKALTRLRRVSAKQVIVAGVFTLAVVGAAGAGLAMKPHASAAPVSTPNCDANAVVWCGSQSASDLISKYNGGDGHNSAASIQNIYNCVGVSAADVNGMTGTANGYVTSTGDVYLGGQLVATGAITGGRQNISGSTAHNCNGTTFYERAPQVSFQDSQLSAIVVMKNGVFQYAILNSCGNPVVATPIVPVYACTVLNMAADSSKLNTYNFTSNVSFSNGATFNHVVYDFGDSSATVTETDVATPVAHTYTKPGSWVAKVTAYFNLPGGAVVAASVPVNCTKSVTVQAPFFTCTYLQAAIPNESNELTYQFTLKASAVNGATFTSVDFDFGDSNTTMAVKPGTGANALIATTSHTYAKASNYTVIPTLHFTTPAGDQTVVGTGSCIAQVSPTLPPQPCQPGGTPAPNSPQCQQPCSSSTSIPATGSPECTPTLPTTPAPTLPNTGAGNVIGLFAGTTILGTAVHFLVQKRRLLRTSL